MTIARQAAAALVLFSGAAAASEAPPLSGRYLPLYPGLYATAIYGVDERDRSFDQSGEEQPTALPALGGETRLPRQQGEVLLAWHFPLFQSYGIPLLSTTPFTARLKLGYSNNRSEGALAAFAADSSDDATTEADELNNGGSGINDVNFEFGGFLIGKPASDRQLPSRFALLLAGGLTLPTGAYDRDAPVNAGENTIATHARLAGSARLWPGAIFEAGYAQHRYAKNQDPAFGGLEPAQRGDERRWDASLSQKIFGGLYLAAFASDRRGDPNRYDNPRFSPDPPEPGAGLQDVDNFPTPGSYSDGGTAVRRAGASLSYFIGQRWLAALHYVQPLSGKSGEFDLPYTDREPAGCTVGSAGCQTSPGGSTRVDGLGESRAYASDSLWLTLSYSFWQGDTYTCPGCAR